MEQRPRKGKWRTFLDVATVFSFVFNVILLLVLLLSVPSLACLNDRALKPMLSELDAAFASLGEATIHAQVEVNQPMGIRFDLPLNQPLDLNFDLPISQQTVVVLTAPVPLTDVPARFNLPGGGGVINGTVSLSLPPGMQLPVRLDMVVPVQKTIPIQMTVPVSQTIPVQMTIPVEIQLGEAGLNPVVERLRSVFSPLRAATEEVPGGFCPFP
ncbi:MAG TPA: hypothetical protein ENK08_10680 [Chloroflexi bacterium]|nr:hypothetical protein [Chloroflexota bacterium]